MRRCYTILTASFTIWFVVLTLILSPTVGLTQQVYPPPRLHVYKLYLLVVSSVSTAAYSAYIGIKLIISGENQIE